MIGRLLLATAIAGVGAYSISAVDAAGAALTEAPPPVAATRSDLAIACQLAPGFHAIFRATRVTTAREVTRRVLQTQAMKWHYLPIRAACGGRAHVFRPGGSGAFVTDISQSADGRLIGIQGGWGMDKPGGEVGQCFYLRVGEKLIPQDCIRLWAG